jgi:hypothetical protein
MDDEGGLLFDVVLENGKSLFKKGRFKDLIRFEGEQVQRLDVENVLDRLHCLFTDMQSANKFKDATGKVPLFSLPFLFADVLDCLNLLSFNNLSKCVGIVKAGQIWADVKHDTANR